MCIKFKISPFYVVYLGLTVIPMTMKFHLSQNNKKHADGNSINSFAPQSRKLLPRFLD